MGIRYIYNFFSYVHGEKKYWKTIAGYYLITSEKFAKFLWQLQSTTMYKITHDEAEWLRTTYITDVLAKVAYVLYIWQVSVSVNKYLFSKP